MSLPVAIFHSHRPGPPGVRCTLTMNLPSGDTAANAAVPVLVAWAMVYRSNASRRVEARNQSATAAMTSIVTHVATIRGR